MRKIKESNKKIVRKNKLVHEKLTQQIQYKKDFRSRIKKINPDEFLDTSNKPDINVIILTIDCLRNSQLSYNGYFRDTTTFLDSLKSSKFKAIAPSSWTYPSVASILTGLYPHNHNAIISSKVKHFTNLKDFKTIKKSIPTLPEILYFLKYRIYFRTAIDPAIWPFRGRVLSKRKIESLGKNPSKELLAEEIFKDVKDWILKDETSFFAYIHLGELHRPLYPLRSFKNFFGRVKNLPNIQIWDFRRIKEQKGKEFQEYKKNRILLYDNTLRYIDYTIEQFYNFLEESGLNDSTLLIITADHGEEFWEHAKLEAENFYDPRGYYGTEHGHNVFNEIIDVPLLISAPEIPAKKSDDVVSGVDITPTIFDILGVSYYSKLDGQSVFKIKRNQPLLSEAMAYGYEKKALIFGKFKLIFSKEDGVEWVFDLKNDPKEQHPIMDRELTSIFVDKLAQIFIEDEQRKIREIIKRKC